MYFLVVMMLDAVKITFSNEERFTAFATEDGATDSGVVCSSANFCNNSTNVWVLMSDEH